MPAHAPPRSALRRHLPDWLLLQSVRASAMVILLMLVALVGVLIVQAWPSIRHFGPAFLVSSEWRANELERPLLNAAGEVVMRDGEVVTETLAPTFGALPVIFGTAASSGLALLIATPLSFGAALFIVRVAPRLRIAGIVSFLIEFLAAIPSLAYGLWGLFVLAPFVQDHVAPFARDTLGTLPLFQWLFYEQVLGGGGGAALVQRTIPLTGRNLLTGSLILAIMVIPIITAVSRDVLRAVPRAQIEGSLALGATWWQSCWAMLRYGRAGLFGAVLLGLARAGGEAMAVTMVIGNNSQISASIFQPAQTMASLLANEFAEAGDGLHRSSLLEVALLLLIVSLVFNILARWLVVGTNRGAMVAH
ncbi:MAG: phosphate ABC transporter permease subunit PstC [Phycisphaerales bacterium]